MSQRKVEKSLFQRRKSANNMCLRMSENVPFGWSDPHTNTHTQTDAGLRKKRFMRIPEVALDRRFQLNDHHQPKINNAK